MFLNAEKWKVAAETPLGLFLLVFALLALLGSALTWLRLPAQVGEFAEFADWGEVVRAAGRHRARRIALQRRGIRSARRH